MERAGWCASVPHKWTDPKPRQKVPKCAWWACNGCSQCSGVIEGCLPWCTKDTSLHGGRKCGAWKGCALCDICKSTSMLLGVDADEAEDEEKLEEVQEMDDA